MPVVSEPDLLRLPAPVVTGDGVELELRAASVLTRGLAWALDAAVLLVTGAGLGVLASAASTGADAAALQALGIGGAVALLVVVPAVWEALTRGRSPGKAALGLRVVRDDGGPVRARHAALRALVGAAELWGTGGSLAVICSLAHPRGKRVGDLLAGTYVVAERSAPTSAQGSAPVVEVSPPLRAWAASADVGTLPDDVAATARWVLRRGDTLTAAAGDELVAGLAARVRERVVPPPPAGTGHRELLAAVLRERHERDLVRLRARRGRRDVLDGRSRRLQGL